MESMISEVTMAAVRRKYPDATIKCVQVSRNYGRLGGWLRCEFLVDAEGNAFGHSASRVEYEVAP